jgi:hypothetical protein
VPAVKIYIAGPMTGLPQHNYPAFHAATDVLSNAGYEPISPARPGLTEDAARADYMRRGLTDVLEADGVALLPGWERSRGACLEVQVAEALDLPVQPLERWMAARGVLS